MTQIDYRKIQEKWINRWREKDIFTVKPDENKEKFYLTVAYPYPSGSMHVGHGRTYTVPDVIARFKRMQGYNVLFPMAWHVTGSPVLGIAKRIEKNDPKTLHIYGDIYKIDREKLKTFTEPLNIVEHFSGEYKNAMTELGYSIDWSREFLTITPQYSKFIEWQYRTLKSKGLVRKGEHPVRYCPGCDNPVGDHDLLAGESTKINEFSILKFKFYCNSNSIENNEIILPAATLRAETVFGVTNMWINPDIIYQKVRVGDEIWILSEEAAEKLKYQNKNIEILGEIPGSEFIGKDCIEPVNNKKIPILPASFVNPNYATGVVMSVPAHAPYDFVALRDLKSDIIVPVIIETEKYRSKEGKSPAHQIVEILGITNQSDPKLEEATEELYRDEHAKGIMSKSIENYGGFSVNETRKKLIEDLSLGVFYEFSEVPVTCRCGTECVIKILKDQWFLKYSDVEWKKKVHKCLGSMNVVPDEVRQNFEYFIDWLSDWACTRRAGLGTNLPWDKKWLIEPLSDSTIYMAYYTIAPHLREIDPEKLNDEFFNNIFYGNNNEKNEKINIKKIRDEFNYWYPGDFRLSAKDLIGNHLCFHMFHHTAIFPEDKWPKGFVVFGMGLLEGGKMSSSKGNVVLLSDAIEEYGSDTVRLFLMSNAEPWQDFDWKKDLVKNTARKLKQFYEMVNFIINLGDENNYEDIEERDIDVWLMSKFQNTIKETTDALENFQTRKALQYAFFETINDLNWYNRRCTPNKKILKKFASFWVKLMAPFTPFTSEELWEEITDGRGFVSLESYPKYNENLINKEVEIQEEMLKELMENLRNILELTKQKPEKIHLYLAPKWMRELYVAIGKDKKINEIMQNPEMKPHGSKIAKIMKKTFKTNIPEVVLALDDEYKALADAKNFIEKEFKCKFEIQKEINYDPENKAVYAKPMKPGVFVE